ncbi:hypothetical protein BDZ45DRAFT_740610 [Acephala macrosclerotiorum]|nr:hypothetical protein BDZ45DRAFT_740610 [Acephala macrosclerotiorum]
MHLPRFIEPLRGNKYCRLWDRIFHPSKECPNPSYYPTQTYQPPNAPPGTVAHPAPASTTSTSEEGLPKGNIFIVVILCIIGAGLAIGLSSLIYKMVKAHSRKKKLFREREAAAREGRPLPQPEPVRTRAWFGRAPRSGSGNGYLEMGCFKRGLSRVRSIAKPNGEVQVHMPPPSRVSLAPPWTQLTQPHLPRGSGSRPPNPPSYPLPQYDNTPRGSPIADQFAEQRRAENAARQRPHTPPPTYAQRTGDRMYEWEDDHIDEPVPDYVSTSWNPWIQTDMRQRPLEHRRGGRANY